MNFKRTIIVLATICICLTTDAQQQPMKLWYDRPAEFFEESLPIGNGKIGALVYGNPDDNILYLNDITLWTGKPYDRAMDADAHFWISDIRRALAEEDYAKADSLQLHVQGPNSQFYQPLGTLHIYDWNQGEAKGYCRELDIDSALCRDHYVRNGITFTILSSSDEPFTLQDYEDIVAALRAAWENMPGKE